ncbi:MAG: SDR family NAD(P)-dependent oxidoreductase [Bacteroidales bacterium]|nr:SDR family NAD(P)-dependent oxidoreductase [Bacteroidales bacterium]MBP5796159.1 SDR family NAD(P)-dependent oxidoreductase [Bacteroidales bacterium]
MTALITGGSSGMGFHYASQLAARGCDVVLVSNREEELQEAAQKIRATYGVNVIPHFQDLGSWDAADNLYAFCKEQGLQVDILVLNAGFFFFKELQAADCNLASSMIGLHVNTSVRACLLFGEDMKKAGRGNIIIMSSMAAAIPAPGISVYSASKAFLKSFGKSLYYEMKPYGVGVTTVLPAAIATPLYKLSDKLLRLGVKTGVIRTPQSLVRRALKGMDRGRKTVKPGLMNVLLPGLISILPSGLISALWKKWKR